MTDIPVACNCGNLQGQISNFIPSASNRIVCYCDDCQSYAEFLERQNEILNANGGTEVLQVSPARLKLTNGVEQLACVRLTPKGIFRWYAKCCNTPLGNTGATHKIPFVGLVHSCMDLAEERETTLGPIAAGIHGRFAKGDRSQLNAHDRAPAWLLLKVLRQVLWARLKGEHKRSPFFDGAGRPVVVPTIRNHQR